MDVVLVSLFVFNVFVNVIGLDVGFVVLSVSVCVWYFCVCVLLLFVLYERLRCAKVVARCVESFAASMSNVLCVFFGFFVVEIWVCYLVILSCVFVLVGVVVDNGLFDFMLYVRSSVFNFSVRRFEDLVMVMSYLSLMFMCCMLG